jgi:hypothetical protein
MARNFQPQVRVSVPRIYQGEFEKSVRNGSIQRCFGTYAEIKKRMKYLLAISDDNEVTVYRHRRGEWGEWQETWKLINSKPTLVKQGWG